MMTFQEAKDKADKIGGVVLWWASYYVETKEEYLPSHGSIHYASKTALSYFKQRYRNDKQKEKAAVEKLKKEFRKIRQKTLA